MLQTVILNANIGKSEIDAQNPEIGDKKPEIGNQKPEIENIKLSFDAIKWEIEKHKYNEPTVNNILKIYDEIDTNQIFGASDVKRILDCSSSTSSEIMSKLREMGVVKEIKGKGKGKCRFTYKKEFI